MAVIKGKMNMSAISALFNKIPKDEILITVEIGGGCLQGVKLNINGENRDDFLYELIDHDLEEES
jgi:hypothetical protein